MPPGKSRSIRLRTATRTAPWETRWPLRPLSLSMPMSSLTHTTIRYTPLGSAAFSDFPDRRWNRCGQDSGATRMGQCRDKVRARSVDAEPKCTGSLRILTAPAGGLSPASRRPECSGEYAHELCYVNSGRRGHDGERIIHGGVSVIMKEAQLGMPTGLILHKVTTNWAFLVRRYYTRTVCMLWPF